MSETVILRLVTTAQETTAHWCLCSGEGALHAGSGDLQQAAEAIGGRAVTVLIPGTEVLLTRVAIPARQRRNLLKAVPYLLEEQLAGEIDALHFAIGRRDAVGEVPVAVIALERMENYLQLLQQAGINAGVMLPDTLAVPHTEQGWSLLLDAGTAWLRQDTEHCYAIDTEQAAELLTLALARALEPPPTLQLLDSEAISEFHRYEIQCICEEMGIPLKEEGYGDLLELFARQLSRQPPSLNLLQGRFGQREQLGRQWRPWLPAAVAAGLLLVLQVGNQLLEYARLTEQRHTLVSEIEQIYRTTFPAASRVVDPVVQMRQQLATLQQGTAAQHFARLLTLAADSRREIRGVEFQLLDYRDGVLELVVHAPDLQALDGFKQRLTESKQLSVEITGANTDDKRVEGRLTIRGGA